MRPLDLELGRRRPKAAGWILLAIALGALLDFGADFRRLEGEIVQAGERAARPPARVRGAGATGEAALREADRVARSLVLPWETLFRSLEESTGEGVALLALQPDPQKRSLSISGEARDYAAILAFVARLDERRALRDVHLVRHELREDDPQRPMAFTILASWEPGA